MKRVSVFLMLSGAALFAIACGDRERGASSNGEHRARVLLEVQSPVGDPELYIATQAELATGRGVLEAAATSLGLAARWGEKDVAAAAAKLAPMVESARLGESSLIELIVQRPKAAEAVEIANAVAKAFVDRALEEEAKRADAALQELQGRLDKQEKKLEESRVKLLQVMEKHKIIDLSLGTGPAWMRPAGGTQTARAAILGPAGDAQAARTTILALDRLTGDELIRAAMDLGIQEPTLTARYPEYQNLVLTRSSLLQSGLGNKHPKVVAVEGQMNQLRRLLTEAVEISRNRMEEHLKIAEESLVSTARADKEKQEDLHDEKSASLTYIEHRSDYEQQKQLLNEVKQAAAREGVNSKIPAPSVIVREQAAE